MESLEIIIVDVYGECYMVFFFRDGEGRVVVVVDISIGDFKVFLLYENKEI